MMRFVRACARCGTNPMAIVFDHIAKRAYLRCQACGCEEHQNG